MRRNGTALRDSVRASVRPATPLPTIRTGADDMLECAVYAAAPGCAPAQRTGSATIAVAAISKLRRRASCT